MVPSPAWSPSASGGDDGQRDTVAAVRRALERFTRSMGVLGLGVLGMLAAHCGGYQLAGVLGLDADPAPGSVERIVHVGSHVHDGHHLEATDHVAAVIGDHHAGHAHVLPLASGAFLLSLLVALAAGVLASRRAGLRPPGARTLLLTQLGLFVVMEVGERWFGGADVAAVLGERRVLLALALQLPVAVLVARLSRRVVALVAALFGRPRALRHRASIEVANIPSDVWWSPTRYVGLTAAPRGPPAERFTAT